jgi:glycolate oxidase FAD binding subunit
VNQHAAALTRIIEHVNGARADGTPLEIRGEGSKRFYGETPSGDPLELRELCGITSYEPTELVVTARAGTAITELEETLSARGQCLPFEPPRFDGRGTVGGMVAAGLAGPARSNVGSLRDHVLGIQLLTGRGELLTFGGQVSKNVAGYDVSRLMVGALGILGVLCEVSIKVLPNPVARATLRFERSHADAMRQLRQLASKPLPMSASTWHQNVLYIRLAGAQAALSEACASMGGEQVSDSDAAFWWNSVRDHRHPFFVLSESELDSGECLWRLSVPATSARVELSGRELIEWHGAQRWWRTHAAAAEVRSAAVTLGGHASLVRALDKRPGVFTPLDPALLKIHRNLKEAFDPQRILNRGRLFPEL